jgi:hypothetical protein
MKVNVLLVSGFWYLLIRELVCISSFSSLDSIAIIGLVLPCHLKQLLSSSLSCTSSFFSLLSTYLRFNPLLACCVFTQLSLVHILYTYIWDCGGEVDKNIKWIAYHFNGHP